MAQGDTATSGSSGPLTGPGGPYELGMARVGAASFNVFVNAPRSLREIYEAAAAASGDRDFYVFEDERISFAEAWQQALRVASALTAMGVKPGDRVGISMRNYPEWLLAFMGITSIGAVAVP